MHHEMYIDYDWKDYNTDRHVESFADRGQRSRPTSETGPEAAVLTDYKIFLSSFEVRVLFFSPLSERMNWKPGW